MSESTETEMKILASAEKLFYQRGKPGTSMQDIADDAGINRTLLNYYYRTKDQLFEAVFRRAMARFVPNLAALLHSELEFREYVPLLVTTVIDAMIENPQIPIFVLQEISSNPERMPQIIMEMGIDPSLAIRKMEQDRVMEGEGGTDPRQLIINVLSLCIFPFAARPVIKDILYHGDQDEFLKAMRDRREYLPQLLQTMIPSKK